MCKLKSCIVLKDKVFCPEYDSHTDMLAELNIEDDFFGGTKKFVRVELCPPTIKDVFTDPMSWKLTVDQDIFPDWWDEEYYFPKIVEAVNKWKEKYVFENEEDKYFKTNYRDVYYFKNVDMCILGDGGAYIFGDSRVETHDTLCVYSFDNSQVVAYDRCNIKACDKSTVVGYGTCHISACDESTIDANSTCDVSVSSSECSVKASDNSFVEFTFAPKYAELTDFSAGKCFRDEIEQKLTSEKAKFFLCKYARLICMKSKTVYMRKGLKIKEK